MTSCRLASGPRSASPRLARLELRSGSAGRWTASLPRRSELRSGVRGLGSRSRHRAPSCGGREGRRAFGDDGRLGRLQRRGRRRVRAGPAVGLVVGARPDEDHCDQPHGGRSGQPSDRRLPPASGTRRRDRHHGRNGARRQGGLDQAVALTGAQRGDGRRHRVPGDRVVGDERHEARIGLHQPALVGGQLAVHVAGGQLFGRQQGIGRSAHGRSLGRSEPGSRFPRSCSASAWRPRAIRERTVPRGTSSTCAICA